MSTELRKFPRTECTSFKIPQFHNFMYLGDSVIQASALIDGKNKNTFPIQLLGRMKRIRKYIEFYIDNVNRDIQV